MSELASFYAKLAGLAIVGGPGPQGAPGSNAAAIMGTPGVNDVSVGAQGPQGYPLLASAYSFNGNDGLHGFVGNNGLPGLAGTQGAAGQNRPYTPYALVIDQASTTTLGSLPIVPRPMSLDVQANSPVTVSVGGYIIYSGTKLNTTVLLKSATPVVVSPNSATIYRVAVAEL